jgi:hypothetical protein
LLDQMLTFCVPGRLSLARVNFWYIRTIESVIAAGKPCRQHLLADVRIFFTKP